MKPGKQRLGQFCLSQHTGTETETVGSAASFLSLQGNDCKLLFQAGGLVCMFIIHQLKAAVFANLSTAENKINEDSATVTVDLGELGIQNPSFMDAKNAGVCSGIKKVPQLASLGGREKEILMSGSETWRGHE